MIYLTLKEALLLVISVSSLTIMLYNKIKAYKETFKRCTFIDAY